MLPARHSAPGLHVFDAELLDEVADDEHRAFLDQQIGQPDPQPGTACEELPPGVTNRGQSVQARSAGMDADRFVVLCPDGHHRFEIGARQGVVKATSTSSAEEKNGAVIIGLHHPGKKSADAVSAPADRLNRAAAVQAQWCPFGRSPVNT